jgi:hypothetical protein
VEEGEDREKAKESIREGADTNLAKGGGKVAWTCKREREGNTPAQAQTTRRSLETG